MQQSSPPSTRLQRVYLPSTMVKQLERHAAKTGQSTSWCLRMAYNLAAQELGQKSQDSKSGARPRGSLKLVCAELPAEVVRALDEDAWRLDRSKSWVMQQAWKIAHPRFQRSS